MGLTLLAIHTFQAGIGGLQDADRTVHQRCISVSLLCSLLNCKPDSITLPMSTEYICPRVGTATGIGKGVRGSSKTVDQILPRLTADNFELD